MLTVENQLHWEDFGKKLESAYAAITEDTFANVAWTVVQSTQKCADAYGVYFEQLL